MQQLLELHADEGKADEAEGGSGTSTAREVKQQLKMAVAELKDIVPSGDTVPSGGTSAEGAYHQ